MFHQRMSSPYLPDSDYSDYLISQYQDILDVCKATMPELIIRNLPSYGDASVSIGMMSSATSTMYVDSALALALVSHHTFI